VKYPGGPIQRDKMLDKEKGSTPDHLPSKKLVRHSRTFKLVKGNSQTYSSGCRRFTEEHRVWRRLLL